MTLNRRRSLVGAVLVLTSAVVATVMVVALSQGIENIRLHRKVFELNNDLGKYESAWAVETSDGRLMTAMLPVSNYSDTAFDELFEQFDLMEALLADFEAKYKKMKRTRPAMRRKTEKSFERYIEHNRESVAQVEFATDTIVRNFPRAPREFLRAYQEFEDSVLTAARPAGDRLVAKARRCLSRESRRSSRVFVAVCACCIGVALVALATVLVLLVVILQQTRSKLDAQNQLAKQQAHEMRNKFAPAIMMIDAVLDIEGCNDLDKLKLDLRAAASLLREVEQQHQARLDCYKIMQGKYRIHMETFDILTFMRTRLDAEATIAKAKGSGLGSTVSFMYELGGDESGANAVHVRTDMYILNHVASNFLSNARKFTTDGFVKLTFCGANSNGLLVFRVQDTGRGVPATMRDKLFRTEVTTGDQRGTGLGLPSCRIFCRAAKGYARLTESRLTDEAAAESQASGSIFEFAVEGSVVSVERDRIADDASPEMTLVEQHHTDAAIELTVPRVSDPQPHVSDRPLLPHDVRVFVVDDSDINRACIHRSLEKVAARAHAIGWRFVHYETVESAMPALVDVRAEPRTVVTVDQNLFSKGGIITGSKLISTLVAREFQGCIISASGDAEIEAEHIKLGAHIAWGKPLPNRATILADLKHHFDASTTGSAAREEEAKDDTPSSYTSIDGVDLPD